uniref:Secreted phosphoprotein 1 n=1 Tax=Tetraodon nigroviridis TaxID=99883 RepID=H3BWC1_TETNG
MRVAIIFVLLFATVLCRPARKVSDSSESSEEVVKRRPAVSASRQKTSAVSRNISPVQNVPAVAPSDESTETSEEDDEEAAQAPEEVKSDVTDSFSDTASVDSNASAQYLCHQESDEDEDDSDLDELSTPAPATASPEDFTEEPVAETTAEPFTDNGRGDSIGGYPGDYKSIIYFEDKSYHKIPGPYKSYEYVDTGKKTGYDMNHGNDVEKSMQVYKTFPVHSYLVEDDTSTPEVDNQGMDISSSKSQDQGPLPEEGDNASTRESGSTSNPDEEEEESISSASDSSSRNSEPEKSSEESAADSTSDESNASQSDSEEGAAGLNSAADAPAVIAAK